MTNKLADLVDDVIDASKGTTTPTPQTITAAVLHQIGDDCAIMKEALELLLPGYVGDRLRRQRNNAMSGVSKTVPGGYLSAKVKAIRDFYTDLMDSSLHVGPNKYLRIADCTKSDLEYAINERKAQVKAEQIRIDQLERLASLLTTPKMKVSKIPRTAVENAMLVAA